MCVTQSVVYGTNIIICTIHVHVSSQILPKFNVECRNVVQPALLLSESGKDSAWRHRHVCLVQLVSKETGSALGQELNPQQHAFKPCTYNYS